MFLVGIISWWYGQGWQGQWSRVRDRLTRTADFFSIGQLALTLFAPFRQISANSAGGSFGAVMRGVFDKLISRVIGAIVRIFTILFGLVVLLVELVYELVIMIFWFLLPIFPVIGLIVMAVGWVPKWM